MTHPKRPAGRAIRPVGAVPALSAVLLILLVLLVLSPTAPALEGEWRYPRYDDRNSGVTPLPSDMVQAPAMVWTFQMDEMDGGSYPVAADLDFDGRMELIVGDAAGTMYCLDAVSGTLRWRTTLPIFFKWGNPVLTDLDGDGDLDIAVSALDLYAIDGPSGQVLWRALDGKDMLGMTAGDVDGDGSMEVFAADFTAPRHCYLVRGADGAVIWSTQSRGSVYNLPVFHDINGDGRKEILFTRHGNGPRETVVCRSSSDGSRIWRHQCAPDAGQEALAPPELGYIADYGYQSVTVADFDGDGADEICSGTDLNKYLFEEDGTLIWKVHQGILGNGLTRTREADGSYSYRDHHYQIYDQAVLDLDGDGGLDLVYNLISDFIDDVDETTGASNRTFIQYRNQVRAVRAADGSLLWTFDAGGATDLGQTRDPIGADVDGDGRPEVIVSSDDEYLYALEGESGAVLWRLHIGYWPLNRGRILVDADRDGLGELIVVSESRVMLYDGPTLTGDIDDSGRVDGMDLLILGWAFGSSAGDPETGDRYVAEADLDENGTIDGEDLATLAANFGRP